MTGSLAMAPRGDSGRVLNFCNFPWPVGDYENDRGDVFNSSTSRF